MENKGWGAPICISLLGVIIVAVAILFLETVGIHVWHEWNARNIDGTSVNVCHICGKIKQEDPPRHSHIWEVKKEGDEIIAYCSSCGETAGN